jgi:hypothetical protein
VRPRRRVSVLSPALPRSGMAILHSGPRLGGWCRTRWSCAPIAGELSIRRKRAVAAETIRRWLQAVDWEGKRAQLRATDDAPQRGEQLARIRYAWEQLGAGVPLFFADELEIHLFPQVGSQGMPKGPPVEVLTPGTHENRYVGGALELTTGTIPPWVGYRKTTGLFLALLNPLDPTHPAPRSTHLTVVVDNAKRHQAKKVQKWLAAHPRFERLSRPPSCPRATPLERAFGEIHDKCTRTQTRQRIWQLVHDVKQQLLVKGPWPYALSELSYTPEVSAAVEALRAAHTTQGEISQLAA